MRPTELAAHDGLGLAALIERRETTPRELGAVMIEAIGALNPKLNAVIEIYEDAFEGLKDSPGPGPYRGLPTVTKDFPIEAGRLAQFGSVFAREFRASHDSDYWQKLRAGGLIVLRS